MDVCFYSGFVCLLSSAFLLGMPFSSYASLASGSNASYVDMYDISGEDGILGTGDDLIIDEDEWYEEVYVNAEAATPSDAVLGEILSQVSAIRDAVSPASEDLEDEEEIESSDSVVLYASGDISFPDHDVVLIKGTFSGTEYTVVVPADVYPVLFVGDNGVLYNISSASITCRMFEGDVFSVDDYNYDNLILAPVLGSSANTLYRYGSLSYRQSYYRGTSSTSLSSTTTYGDFYVDEVLNQRSLSVDYRLYYVSVVCLFLLGVIVLCSWKNLRH